MSGHDHNGLTETLRAMLPAAPAGISSGEIRSRLDAMGQTYAASGLSGILRTRVVAGEFQVSGNRGDYLYSLNPDYDPEAPQPRELRQRSEASARRPHRSKEHIVRVKQIDLRRVVRLAIRVVGPISEAERNAINACSEVMYG